jgi:hypothetical protein
MEKMMQPARTHQANVGLGSSPAPAMFAQLLVGLINGAFYAMLSLGLAVIFGLLNIINFTHGAQCRGLRPISKPPGRGSFERAIAGSG